MSLSTTCRDFFDEILPNSLRNYINGKNINIYKQISAHVARHIDFLSCLKINIL